MYTNTIPASWLEHVCLYIDYLTNLISSLHLQLLKQLLNRLQIKAHSLSTAIHKENNKFANIHKYSQDIFAELVTCSFYEPFLSKDFARQLGSFAAWSGKIVYLILSIFDKPLIIAWMHNYYTSIETLCTK